MRSTGFHRWLLAACAMVLATPLASFGQPPGRVSIAGTVEYARITADDSFLGAGSGGAGSVAFHLSGATSLEIEVGVECHIRDLQFFAVAFDANGVRGAFPFVERWEGTAAFALGLVSHAFRSGAVRPVVWGGAGLMHHGGTRRGPRTLPQIPPGYTLQPGDAETRQGRESTALALDAGGGVDVRATDRLTLRPFAGLRLVNTGNVGPKYIIRTGARLAFRW